MLLQFAVHFIALTLPYTVVYGFVRGSREGGEARVRDDWLIRCWARPMLGHAMTVVGPGLGV